MKISKKATVFQKKINDYFLNCELDGIYPDEAGLILHLELDKETYENFKNNRKGTPAGYMRCLEDARLRRESILVRDIYSNEKSSTGKIFLARQPGNGGLCDKAAQASEKTTVEVLIDGEPVDHFD